MTRITALSTICADIFEDTGEILLGGEALNFVMNIYNEPDLRVSLIGAVGGDNIADIATSALEKTDIDISCVHRIENGETASHLISLTKDGDRYFKDGAWNGGVYESYKLCRDDAQKIISSDIVYINFPSPNMEEVLELKKQHSFKLAIDFDVLRDFESIADILEYTDFFFLSGTSDIAEQICALSEKHGGIFNMTLAEKGSVTYINGREYSVNAVKVPSVLDTTGCGDSYHAGFLASYSKDGDIIKAMEKGSLLASVTLSHLGGFVQ